MYSFFRSFLSVLVISVACIHPANSQDVILNKVNNFARLDTIKQPDPDFVNLAMKAKGDQIVVLEGTNTEYSENKTAYMGGFRLSSYKKVGDDWVFVKKSNVTSEKYPPICYRYQYQFDYNTFVETDYGYVVCAPAQLAVFDKEFNIISSATFANFAFASAAPIKGTSQIAIVAVNYKTKAVVMYIYDYKTRLLAPNSLVTLVPGKSDSYVYLDAQSTRLVQDSDGDLFLALKTTKDFTKQLFLKLSLEKFQTGHERSSSVIWEKSYDVKLNEMKFLDNGSVSLVVRIAGVDGRYEMLQHVIGNTRVKTADEFNSSLKSAKTSTGLSSPPGEVLVRKLNDNSFVAIGRGQRLNKMGSSVVMIRYTTEMKILGQYRLPSQLKLWSKPPTASDTYTRARQISNITIEPDGDIEKMGLYKKNHTSLLNNLDQYLDYYRGENSAYDVMNAPTGNDLIVLTSQTIYAVNLNEIYENAPNDGN